MMILPGFDHREPGDGLAQAQNVVAGGVRPAGLLGSGHLAQLRARIGAVLGGHAAALAVKSTPVRVSSRWNQGSVKGVELGLMDLVGLVLQYSARCAGRSQLSRAAACHPLE
jgi:hypothetical protein